MRWRRLLLLTTLFMTQGVAPGQIVQNMDMFFLGGASRAGSRQVPGTIVTLNANTRRAMAVGYGYQLARVSSLGVWLDFSPSTSVRGRGSATVPGYVNDGFLAMTVAARFMAPVHARLSIYGIVGGGGGSFYYASVLENPARVLTSSVWHGLAVTGGGVDVRLSRRISLRGELRDFITAPRRSGATGRHHPVPFFGVAFHF